MGGGPRTRVVLVRPAVPANLDSRVRNPAPQTAHNRVTSSGGSIRAVRLLASITSHSAGRGRLPTVAAKPFEQIVTEHGPTVLRVCRAVLGPADAEDAWSETFLAALRAYPDLRPGSNVEAWLVTIAKRKAIDQHRQRHRQPIPVETVPPARNPPPAGSDGHEAEHLWDALRVLPLKQREAVAYHYLGGLPYAEVAQLLGKSEAAARRAASDGIQKLRATYRGET